MKNLKELGKYYTDYKYLTLCLISIVILVATGGLLVWPLYAEHLSIEQQSKAVQQRLQILEQFASMHGSYDEEHSRKEMALQKLQEKLPSDLAKIDAMNKVQQIAHSSGVKLNASRIVNNNAQQGKLTRAGVEVKAIGSYTDIFKFLENLEQRSLTGLEQLNLQAREDGNLMLNGKYYVYGLREG